MGPTHKHAETSTALKTSTLTRIEKIEASTPRRIEKIEG